MKMVFKIENILVQEVSLTGVINTLLFVVVLPRTGRC